MVSYLALLSAPRSFFLYVNVGVGKTNTHDNRTGSSKQPPPPRPSIQQQSLGPHHHISEIQSIPLIKDSVQWRRSPRSPQPQVGLQKMGVEGGGAEWWEGVLLVWGAGPLL